MRIEHHEKPMRFSWVLLFMAWAHVISPSGALWETMGAMVICSDCNVGITDDEG